MCGGSGLVSGKCGGLNRSMQHHLKDLLFKDGVYDPEETVEAFSYARSCCMEAVEGRAVVACDRSRIWQAAYFHSSFIVASRRDCSRNPPAISSSPHPRRA